MFELMEMGIDMQRRMVDAQAQGLKAAGEMLKAAERQSDMLEALNEAGKAQASFVKKWMSLWGGRA